MEVIYQINEIDEVAKSLWSRMQNYRVFAFSGQLGAGKTALITSFCRTLGVLETVSSPTFSIVQEYTTAAGHTIYHMDLYRIRSEEEAIDAGIEDCLCGNNICFVEWPEKAPKIFPANTVFTDIQIVGSDSRKLIIHIPS